MSGRGGRDGVAQGRPARHRTRLPAPLLPGAAPPPALWRPSASACGACVHRHVGATGVSAGSTGWTSCCLASRLSPAPGSMSASPRPCHQGRTIAPTSRCPGESSPSPVRSGPQPGQHRGAVERNGHLVRRENAWQSGVGWSAGRQWIRALRHGSPKSTSLWPSRARNTARVVGVPDMPADPEGTTLPIWEPCVLSATRAAPFH